MITNPLSWTAAQATCKAENANLVTVNSESENAALIVMGYRELEPIWLGMKKVSRFYEVILYKYVSDIR